jgi:hypothetical protein
MSDNYTKRIVPKAVANPLPTRPAAPKPVEAAPAAPKKERIRVNLPPRPSAPPPSS